MMTTKETAAATLVSSVIKLADSLRLRDDAPEARLRQADRMEAEAEAEARASGHNVQDVINAAYKLVYGRTADELLAGTTGNLRNPRET